MDEKRGFNRWAVENSDKAVVSCADAKEEGAILDMSVSGMRVSLHKPLDVGSVVYGQFNVLDFPYYVRGKVNRLMEIHGEWEVAIAFEKVSSVPLNA
ncbi:MAG: PilZ domain-containing protein [Candidatus Omnitrophica bacterium]|nr:PilZ domain-containing protein [Candidatus Omnitrophota bacterium]